MSEDRLSPESATHLLGPLTALASDTERGVFLADASGRIEWANPAALRLCGIPASELIGGRLRFRICDSGAPKDGATRPLPLDADTPSRQVLQVLTDRGKAVWIDLEVLRDEAAGATAGGFAVLATDITRRKQAESELAESEERYHGLVDLCPDPIAVHDGQKILYANVAATEMLGAAAPAELVGRPVLDIVHPDSQDVVAERIRKLQEVGEPMPLLENKLCRLDGSAIEVEMAAATITWSGQPAVQVVARDVSARRIQQREALVREARLRESQHLDSLGRLAAGIAHDFNNVLATILGNADFLFEDLETISPLRKPLRDIRRAALKASRLTEEILTFAEGSTLEPRSLDVSSLLFEMSNLVESAVSKKVSVNYDLSGQLPRVEGDPVQLRRAFLNLILNASEAARDATGTISVRANVRRVDASTLAEAHPRLGVAAGRFVAVEIRDQGSGMDAIAREQAFEPFFSTRSEGRGLGLPAALGVVRSHGGAIRIDSEPGKGTCVTVFLPCSAAAVSPLHEVGERSVGAATARETEGITVLVADDEPGVRRMVARILERAGFRVLTAKDGNEAVAVFERNQRRIGAALLDLTMPGLSGDEVCERIRERAPDLPILFSSGFSRRALSERVIDLERTGFLAKPYESRALLESLRALLGE